MNKQLIAFKALLQGNTIDFVDNFANTIRVRLFKPNDIINFPSFGPVPTIEYLLTAEMIKNKDEKVYIDLEMSLDDFAEKCEKLSDDYITKLAMENVLNETREKNTI